ncbi:DUF2190 family protein [Aliiroseovarius marinus]|uniref:DUF2190 family protein n=1 Tax=Aliiroseovarius marinus TaxID=2500159 RepID=UPI003D7E4C6A
MPPSSIDILTITVAALSEPVKLGQLVGYDGAPAGVGDPVLGVAKYDAETGRPVAVVTCGVVEMKAASNIAVGDLVYADAAGNPTSVGNANPFGFAIQGGGTGDRIAVLLK